MPMTASHFPQVVMWTARLLKEMDLLHSNRLVKFWGMSLSHCLSNAPALSIGNSFFIKLANITAYISKCLSTGEKGSMKYAVLCLHHRAFKCPLLVLICYQSQAHLYATEHISAISSVLNYLVWEKTLIRHVGSPLQALEKMQRNDMTGALFWMMLLKCLALQVF